MSNQIVRAQMNKVDAFLNNVVKELDIYLDHHHLAGLLGEKGSKEREYYRSLLKSLRRLEVICDEAKDTIGILLQSEVFRKTAAERTLYGIYHQCIGEFFSPKGDGWYEDSRAAYTGRHAILFHNEPPESLRALMIQLEKPFQEIREELEYYETDYQLKIMKQ
ncbi:DUF3907 family protein [Thalassobacillus devorans]|uniref:DUF3907 family protein n=1 Tax=Thalassobacillus devorans TaxID=279813 RepID=UPI00049060CB|nr:DUF3907 family protein [Thalassobacillus devorans]